MERSHRFHAAREQGSLLAEALLQSGPVQLRLSHLLLQALQLVLQLRLPPASLLRLGPGLSQLLGPGRHGQTSALRERFRHCAGRYRLRTLHGQLSVADKLVCEISADIHCNS